MDCPQMLGHVEHRPTGTRIDWRSDVDAVHGERKSLHLHFEGVAVFLMIHDRSPLFRDRSIDRPPHTRGEGPEPTDITVIRLQPSAATRPIVFGINRVKEAFNRALIEAQPSGMNSGGFSPSRAPH